MCDMDLPYRQVFFPLGFSIEIFTNYAVVLPACEESFGHLCTLSRSTSLAVPIGVFENGKTDCPLSPLDANSTTSFQ